MQLHYLQMHFQKVQGFKDSLLRVLSALPYDPELYERVGDLYCQGDKFLLNIAPVIK